MRIEQLICLLEISQQKSLNTASERLHMTQQALSSTIKTMEKELDTRLLNRTRQGCTLTPDGERVLAYAAEIVPKYHTLLRDLRGGDTAPELLGTLQSYVNSIVYISLLPGVIKRLCAKCPQIKVVILEQSPTGICARLKEPQEAGVHRIGLINVPYADEDGGSLCSGFIPASGVSFHPLAKGSYHACVSRKSPLAASRELSLKTLLQYPIVLGASDEGNTTPLHYLLNRYGTPDIVLSAGSVSLWNHAIANGMGIGFLHDIFLDGDGPRQSFLDGLSLIKVKERIVAVTGYLLAEEPSDIVRELIRFLPASTS